MAQCPLLALTILESTQVVYKRFIIAYPHALYSPLTSNKHRIRSNAKTYCAPPAHSKMIVNIAPSTDSDLEAFNHNPTDVSFAALAFQLATFTKYLNEVFLSY